MTIRSLPGKLQAALPLAVDREQPLSCAANLGEGRPVAEVLRCWHGQGLEAARSHWASHRPSSRPLKPLEQELELRLAGAPGPRLLLDGLWFCRPLGGIGRVWQQILGCWSLPGLITPQAPLCLIDRDSHMALTSRFEVIQAAPADPLDWDGVAEITTANADLARRWRAQVFLSSWISSCGDQPLPAIPELALVHDCIPERSQVPEALTALRRRWLLGAQAQLAVSAATANDIEQLLQLPRGAVPWCHPAADPLFAATVAAPGADRLWHSLQSRLGLWDAFVLLPGTSRLGSYKNPELVARAVGALPTLQLVLCGKSAKSVREELEQASPELVGRCVDVHFTEPELALAYRQALAVVVPSRVEGFGLPALEAAAAGGVVIVADSRGLREAAAEAALRVQVDQPHQLVSLLQALLDPSTRSWLKQRLQPRSRRRLQRSSPDLLGLSLLAAARALAARRQGLTS
ncbi:hypothetical protein SynPROS71_00149 [Synechococcus sp. PROS-7-1]|uniref:glycosyltransferase n=1 Tax=Synechococcus sp. PROS-7-1 TaxID=1442556 RepID=UPI00164522D2|nr:glycosyltransferase [Synechococcus sp. PROS-7-1]QNI83988.1 hypothetical protein SynPROS71_00149 [Synechococcus sp. PROS-7-1]